MDIQNWRSRFCIYSTRLVRHLLLFCGSGLMRISDGSEANRRPPAHGVGDQLVSAPLHGFGTFAGQCLDNSTGQPGDGKRTAKGRKKASAG